MQLPKWLLKASVHTLLIQFFIISPLQANELEELLNTDLATLMDMQIITPARKGQTVAQAPASVTVVSREMMIRRGYQTLEDVLKDVPGFDFATSQPAGEYPTHFLFRGIGDLGQTKMLIM
ncbi:MAG: TonB-dependent receptor plug domain-containing protein, partial [Candidatus Latescibacteria bacterium]|nr:TonB-dependent receptor plug domain-containing protein [Candidatus Latescibacterota bacterium]